MRVVATCAAAFGAACGAADTTASATATSASDAEPGAASTTVPLRAQRIRCLDDRASSLDDTLRVGAYAWQLSNHHVTRTDAAAGSDTGAASTIGVVADAGDARPTTLAALGRFRPRLDAAHVDVVISFGGLGATQAELAASLSALATGASWPIVALPAMSSRPTHISRRSPRYARTASQHSAAAPCATSSSPAQRSRRPRLVRRRAARGGRGGRRFRESTS